MTVNAPLEVLHQFVETPVLLALGAADGELWQDTLLPAATAEQPLLRCGAQVTFVVAWPDRLRIALQHAEFGEQFTAGDRFPRG